VLYKPIFYQDLFDLAFVQVMTNQPSRAFDSCTTIMWLLLFSKHTHLSTSS